MTLAMKRLKNLGWLALVFMVAVLLYPLSLNVAALHSDLTRIDRDILETRQEISFLQAEIRTRASVAQLEEWNQLLYGYEPPRADQFIDGERGLASIGGATEGVKPVLVAVDMPAGEVGSVGVVPSAPEEIADFAPAIVRTASAILPSTPEKPASKDVASAKAKAVAQPTAKAKTQTRTERLANIDEKLLSDNLMREIQTRSDRELRSR